MLRNPMRLVYLLIRSVAQFFLRDPRLFMKHVAGGSAEQRPDLRVVERGKVRQRWYNGKPPAN